MNPYYRASLLTFVTFLGASLASIFVLNRWAFTDLGVLSYGRVWQLYISYGDFGFIRRAFIGTVLSESGVNSAFGNEYHFAILLHHAAILTLSALILYYCISRRISNVLFIATIAFSPALIIQSGYTTGSLDIFVLILAAINILYVRNILLFSILISIGIITHELFIFTIPAQLIAIFSDKSTEYPRSRYFSIIAPSISSLFAIILITFFGVTGLSQGAVESIMAQKIPNAAGQHSLWSGYVEISRTAEQNASSSIENLSSTISNNPFYFAIPIMYVLLVTIRASSHYQGYLKLSALIAIATPLLTSFVATDYYRWIGMSANMAILLTLINVGKNGRYQSNLNTPLIVMCLLAPFGGAEANRPFPMHQFIIERL